MNTNAESDAEASSGRPSVPKFVSQYKLKRTHAHIPHLAVSHLLHQSPLCHAPPPHGNRKNKVSALTSLKYVDAWCVFFWATTPTIVCLVTFATLVVVRGEGAPPLKVSSVFAGVGVVGAL